MKFLFIQTVLIFTLFNAGCTGSKQVTAYSDTLHASSLHPFGRYAISDQQQVELIGSASHIGFSFKGKSCAVYAYLPYSGHSYLQYVLDGVYQKRVRLDGGSREPFIISSATDSVHAVWIYKATEAHTGPVFIEMVTGENLQALKDPDVPVIEFIGNSITCGACSDESEIACGSGVYHDQHNAYYAYGPRVARSLGVNFIISAVSGFGIYRTWNADGPNLPMVYEKADLQDWSKRMWDFKTYKPKIVSVALGTNDYSDGDGKTARLPFNSTVFITGYIKFVQLVKSKYPEAQIALLSSPMLNGDKRISLQNCLTAVKQKIDALYPSDKPVALYFFNPMQPRGCSGHPSVEDHAIMANELIPFFKKLL